MVYENKDIYKKKLRTIVLAWINKNKAWPDWNKWTLFILE